MENEKNINCEKCDSILDSFETKYYSNGMCLECKRLKRKLKREKEEKVLKRKKDFNSLNLLSLIIGLVFMFPVMFLPIGLNYIWSIIVLVIWKMFKTEFK